MEKDKLDELRFIPTVNFNKTLDLIHKKDIEVNTGIVRIEKSNYKILKDSKLSIKKLVLEIYGFVEFPDKLELSPSILDAIKLILVECEFDYDEGREEIDYLKVYRFMASCSKI